VLKTSGHAFLFWNTRDTQFPAAQLFEDLTHKWNPEHVLAYRRQDWGDRFEASGLFERIEHRSYRQTVAMSIDDWIGLSRSISYIQSIGPAKVAGFERDLRAGLDRLPSVDCGYTTEVWSAQKKS
jgi:hypothetical protein